MPEPLPSEELRAIIGDAVHHAVSKLFEPTVVHAAPINTVGCFLLQHLFGRSYQPVCGSIAIQAAGTPFGLEARADDLDSHEYYLWGELVHDDGSIEQVDFAARYWPAWAKGIGILWVGRPVPTPLWTLKASLSESVATYTVDDAITEAVQGAIGRAIAVRDTESPVTTWENAINDAIDYVASTDAGLAHMVQCGLAEPIDEMDNA